MSSGNFTDGIYLTDLGTALRLRFQPEDVIGTVNPAATGTAVAGSPSARISGSPRGKGVWARRVYGKWTTAPAGYQANGRVTLVIFTKAAFDAIADGQEITYLGGTFKVTGKRNESIK